MCSKIWIPETLVLIGLERPTDPAGGIHFQIEAVLVWWSTRKVYHAGFFLVLKCWQDGQVNFRVVVPFEQDGDSTV